MAQKKQPYTWTRVKPGDIISFRYKSKNSSRSSLHTILVLNPKLPVSLKDGTKTNHLIGIKLEESKKIQLRLTNKQVLLIEKIGDLVKLNPDEDDDLYKLEIHKRFILNDVKGVKQPAWDLISRSLPVQGQYRTYDYKKSRTSAVNLEPIKLFTEQSQGLDEQEKEIQEKEIKGGGEVED